MPVVFDLPIKLSMPTEKSRSVVWYLAIVYSYCDGASITGVEVKSIVPFITSVEP
jgi:hypothetical protein